MWSETEGLSGNQYIDTRGNGSNDLKKVLIGALAGVIAGALVGSLYTEKGTRVRRRVSNSSRDLARRVKQKTSDINEGIKDKASDITGKIKNKLDATKETLTKVFKEENRKSNIASVNSAYTTDHDENVRISKTKVLLAILAASAAGTIVWSFTTEKGKKTRQQVGSSSKKMAANIKAKVPGIVKTVKEVYREAKEGVQEIIEKEKQNATGSAGSNAYGKSSI